MKLWNNKKYRAKKNWKGSYQKTKRGERIFVLTVQGPLPKNVEKIERVYESHQAAKKDGWIKLK